MFRKVNIRLIKTLWRASHYSTSHSEKWISSFGASLGIGSVFIVAFVFQHVGILSDHEITYWLLPCFGATSVLLFAIPHSPFSQPWPVLGGYFFSMVSGELSVHFLDDSQMQAIWGVAMAVLSMCYFRCLHPPGAAATLVPVLSGSSNWYFVFNPVLLGAISLMGMAVVYNAFFSWRRYPMLLAAHKNESGKVSGPKQSAITLNHEDISWALQEMNSIIDITPEDLAVLFELATQHQNQSRPSINNIALHSYYSNGRTGYSWQVFEVIAVTSNVLGQRSVTYRVVAGCDKGYEEELTLHQFLTLVVIPVQLKNGHWIRYM